jgi:hypothetical protein
MRPISGRCSPSRCGCAYSALRPQVGLPIGGRQGGRRRDRRRTHRYPLVARRHARQNTACHRILQNWPSTNCVVHESGPDSDRWSFTGPRGPADARVAGPLHANSATMVHRAALAGYGIAAFCNPMCWTTSAATDYAGCCRDTPPNCSRPSWYIRRDAMYRRGRAC